MNHKLVYTYRCTYSDGTTNVTKSFWYSLEAIQGFLRKSRNASQINAFLYEAGSDRSYIRYEILELRLES